MGNLVWTGLAVALIGLIAVWQPRRLASLQQKWDKRMSPRMAPYVRMRPRFIRAVGAVFVLAGALTLIYALVAHS